MSAAQLDDVLQASWQLLVRGGADRRSPLHTPVVASTDANGAPEARVMVLRKAEPGTATLRFHTDARSPKCTQLDGRAVAVLGYHPQEAVQLRLKGRARVLTSDPLADEAWARSTAFARRCYMALEAPGTVMTGPGSGLPPEVEGVRPSEAQLAPARANFALLLVDVAEIDWLHLAHSGHRRARFVRAGSDWTGAWVAP
jgi:hypothetical protein